VLCKGIYSIVLLVFVYGSFLQAQDITVLGRWDLTIDSSDLQGGAGTDLNPTYTSATNKIRVNILNTSTTWSVSVRLNPVNWHSDFRFGVRRTTNGNGPGWISGGTSWMEVTTIDQEFFTGYRRRRNVRVQCGLTGVSVQIPPDLYSISVIYTVIEL